MFSAGAGALCSGETEKSMPKAGIPGWPRCPAGAPAKMAADVMDCCGAGNGNRAVAGVKSESFVMATLTRTSKVTLRDSWLFGRAGKAGLFGRGTRLSFASKA